MACAYHTCFGRCMFQVQKKVLWLDTFSLMRTIAAIVQFYLAILAMITAI